MAKKSFRKTNAAGGERQAPSSTKPIHFLAKQSMGQIIFTSYIDWDRLGKRQVFFLKPETQDPPPVIRLVN
ncbi:MAG: hypothetical protein WA628_16490 [Terriglobales bacterium]